MRYHLGVVLLTDAIRGEVFPDCTMRSYIIISALLKVQGVSLFRLQQVSSSKHLGIQSSDSR